MTLKIYSDLLEKHKYDDYFLSKLFCNGKGNFNRKLGICHCNIGIFGNHCKILGIEIWGKTFWFIFQFIFASLFLFISSLMIYKLVITLINYSSCLSRIFSLFLTPKNLVNLNLMIMSVSRFIYMCYDPYCQYQRANYLFDRIMNELNISSITSIYLLLFIVFIGLDANLRRGTKKISKRCYVCAYKTLKFIVIVLLFFIYPIQIFMSYCNCTIKIEIPFINYLYVAFCVLFFLLFSITFYIQFYLKKQLFKFYEMRKNHKKQEIKINLLEDKIENEGNESNIISTFNEGESNSKLLNSYEFEELKKKNLSEKKNQKNIIEFLTKIIKEKKIDSVSYLLGKKDAEIKYEDEFEKNEDKVFFENEMKILDTFNEENNDFDVKYSYQEHNTLKKENIMSKIKRKISLQIPEMKENTKNQSDDFIMNDNDRELVNNIFHYSFLYMLVTIFYIIITFISRVYIILRINWAMIILYYISHFFDCFYITVIYFLFFKNTSSQEYENLKKIGELEDLIKEKFLSGKVTMVYNDLANSCIADRFKGFINFKH